MNDRWKGGPAVLLAAGLFLAGACTNDLAEPGSAAELLHGGDLDALVRSAAASHGVEPNPTLERTLTAREEQIDHLVAFLISLTDPGMFAASALAPDAVPSGLPVDVAGPQRFPIYGAP